MRALWLVTACSPVISSHAERGVASQDSDAACYEGSAAGTCAAATDAVKAKSLLQLTRSKRENSGSASLAGLQTESDGVSCAPLQNHWTYFTVEVEVGTPRQRLDVVADTGSDALLIASCMCQAQSHCATSDKCFRGSHNASTSFNLATDDDGVDAPSVILTYGSGVVQAVVASDVVTVGGVSANMSETLLLMVDKELDFDTAFEGILGLGPPERFVGSELSRTTTKLKGYDASQDVASGSLVSSATPDRVKQFAKSLGGARRMREDFETRSWLEEAHVDRFSICFNDDSDGALRLNTGPPEFSLGSIGTYHWGLDFRGISIGEQGAGIDIGICSEKTMVGQKTACGLIPDSGTTLIMGPSDGIRRIYEQTCNEWPRCRDAAASPEYKGIPKYEVFEYVLQGCDDWMSDANGGLNELPPMNFRVAGSEGTERTMTLTGSDYVMEVLDDEYAEVTRKIGGLPFKFSVPTGRLKLVCMAAFAGDEYTTMENGPVWILGLPIFYRYEVAYDISSSPPSISFQQGGCGSCGGASLVAKSSQRIATSANATLGRGRRIRGTPRMPSIDRKLPL